MDFELQNIVNGRVTEKFSVSNFWNATKTLAQVDPRGLRERLCHPPWGADEGGRKLDDEQKNAIKAADISKSEAPRSEPVRMIGNIIAPELKTKSS